MLDCGFRLDPPWFPSNEFRGRRIDLLAFTNLDEDHLRDLPYVWMNTTISSVFSNPTLSADALTAIKHEHGMGHGVSYAHAILQRYGSGLIGRVGDLGGVRVRAYWNSFGFDFMDTNNLSLAVFVRYGSFTILFAGDLEEAGWRALLRRPWFLEDLSSVNVFVASHHGRESGCCEEVFLACRPSVFVVSDDEVRYDTQHATDWYRRRALGIPDFRMIPDPVWGYPFRYVLTTRREGTLSTLVVPDGRFLITPQYSSGPLPRFA
jgi:beta-lactamase superfamily II metal-dependent hydrolase